MNLKYKIFITIFLILIYSSYGFASINIVDVTNNDVYFDNYLNVNNTETYDIEKTKNWIHLKASESTESIINVFPYNTNIIIKDITYEDIENDSEDESFRRLKFEHHPEFYENSDDTISDNNIWLPFFSMTTFDEDSIERFENQIKLKADKAGRFIVSLQGKDSIANIYGNDFSKLSNEKQAEIYVHRYPVAIIDYVNNNNGTVDISSLSYDTDFETRADKGISKEIWEYRLIDEFGKIIQDWNSVSFLIAFPINATYITEIRLIVEDYGATINFNNDGILTDSNIIRFNPNTPEPPEANFEFMVDNGKVTANGVGYYGNVGKETISYLNTTIWNDYFTVENHRKSSFNITESNFNSTLVGKNSENVTLEVTNNWKLTDSVSKSIQLKEISLINNSDVSVRPGTSIKFDFDLFSTNSQITKSGNFIVKVDCPDLGINDTKIGQEFGTRYMDVINTTDEFLSPTATETNFIVSVWSKRSEKKLSEYSYTLSSNSPPEILKMGVNPQYIYEGDDIELIYEVFDPDFDNLEINFDLVNIDSNTLYSLSNDIVSSPYQEQTKLLINNVLELGSYKLKLTAIDPFGATITKEYDFMVNPHILEVNIGHNGGWEENRVDYNLNNLDKERSADTFWSIEEFVLNAATTNIDVNSLDISTNVDVKILNEGYNTTLIPNTEREIWNRHYFEESMSNKWGRPPEILRFRFTAYFQNNKGEINIMKVKDVEIIIDNKEEYYLIRRAW